MSRYSKLAPNAFTKLAMNAGVLAKSFDPTTGAVSGIVAVTSGGLAFNAAYSYKDFGEDMDNVPKNTKELKRIESVEAKVSGTFTTIDLEGGKLMIGAADVASNKITPRSDIVITDFTDLWIIADYSQDISESTGGFIAIHMLNALSSGGFSMQTTDKDKGKFSFEFTAHYGYDNPTVVPYEIYINDGMNSVLDVRSTAGVATNGTIIGVANHTAGTGESFRYKLVATIENAQTSLVPLGTSTSLSGWTVMSTNPVAVTTTDGYYAVVALFDKAASVTTGNGTMLRGGYVKAVVNVG